MDSCVVGRYAGVRTWFGGVCMGSVIGRFVVWDAVLVGLWSALLWMDVWSGNVRFSFVFCLDVWVAFCCWTYTMPVRKPAEFRYLLASISGGREWESAAGVPRPGPSVLFPSVRPSFFPSSLPSRPFCLPVLTCPYITTQSPL